MNLRIARSVVESGSHAPGERVRLEQQHRFVGAKAPDPAIIAQSDLGKMWQGQLHAWENTHEIVVADLNSMQRVVLQVATDNKLSAFAAERLLGTLTMRGRGLGKDWWTSQGKGHLWGRRSRELRDLGIILDEDGLGGEHKEAELPLGIILRTLRHAWHTATPEQH